ncbi:MAG: DUF2007 domain-containing protein [bacterium]|nr:DUF2007 domain-containing protein [bacterium]
MANEWAQLASYGSLVEAELDRARLEQAGIEARTASDDVGGAYPVLQGHGCRLFVRAEDRGRAWALLADAPAPPPEVESPDVLAAAEDQVANHEGRRLTRFEPLDVLLIFLLLFFALALASSATAVQEETRVTLDTTDGLQTNGVIVRAAEFGGRRAVEVTMESDFAGGDSNTIALVEGIDFRDGTIEFDVASGVNPESWFLVKWIARGFAGIAFRVADDLSRFESIYLRPTNGDAEDPVRRSHAVQYFSYPDWDFARFREESPGVYEAPAPIGPDRWIHVRVEVAGSMARLYVDDTPEPVLVVNDLKLGPDARGGIALFVDAGTSAWFSNLVVTPAR